MRTLSSVFAITLILVGMFVLALDIVPVKALETIYIRADGSIDPPTANIVTADYVTYTFTDDIYYSQIYLERSNIIVDGAGHKLIGDLGTGIAGYGINNVTVKGTNIRDFICGIRLSDSLNNTISGNTITAVLDIAIALGRSSGNSISGNNLTGNGWGMYLSSCSSNGIAGNNVTANTCGILLRRSSSYNSISGNTITDNGYGLALSTHSLNNTISGNIIANNDYAIWDEGSSGYTVFHNNFIANTFPLYSNDSVTVWDEGYPSGGNYWSNHADTDIFEGPGQNVTGSDGVWDHPYVIDLNNQDRYPLTKPYGEPVGDADGDRDVDIYDIVRMSGVYGVSLPDPLYDRLCDMDLDGDIDIFDIVIAADNYGESW